VRAAIDYQASKYEVINLGESRTVELRELIELLESALASGPRFDWQPNTTWRLPQTLCRITKAECARLQSPDAD